MLPLGQAHSLQELLGAHFAMGPTRTYSRFFSELVDTLVNVGLERLGKRPSAKGMVVTSSDLSRHRRTFRLWSTLYPFVWAVTRLDAVVPASGYMLIAAAERRGRAAQT